MMANWTSDHQPGHHNRSQVLSALAEQIGAVESGAGLSNSNCSSMHDPNGHGFSDTLATQWPVASSTRSISLVRGAVHEWVGTCTNDAGVPGRHGSWSPPLLILIHLARCALQHDAETSRAGCVLWIGRSIWPHHAAMRDIERETKRQADEETKSRKDQTLHPIHCKSVYHAEKRVVRGEAATPYSTSSLRLSVSPSLLRHSLFIDPLNDELRWWAIDQALRCPAVSAVIADARGMDMACSRRMQVAAEAGGGLALLARAPWEVKELSASMTRWSITPRPSPMRLLPMWEVECLRCKGVQRRVGTDATSLRLFLEWNRATGCVGVSAPLADRSSSPHTAPQQRIA